MFELVISIGFFAVISVFILQLFLSANTLEKEAVDLSKATIQAEWIAEGIKGSDTIKEAAELLNLDAKKDGSYEIIYDNRWKITKKMGTYNASVISTVTQTKYGVITKADITISKFYNHKNGEIIYQLPVANYQPYKEDSK
jgi:hypothetical protein